MYGTQAESTGNCTISWFENDVKMYGTQAQLARHRETYQFENDVKMYGTQAPTVCLEELTGLRMM